MRVISSVGCIVLILLLSSGIAACSDIATVHGVAYEWNSFEPLDNAIIEINSTPTQSMIAKNGAYSFGLSNGTYKITAGYYEKQQLIYYAEDTITVSHKGTYVRDLLLLPSYSSPENDINTWMDLDIADISSSGVYYSNSYILDFILVFIAILFLLAYVIRYNLHRHFLAIINKKNKRSDMNIRDDAHGENTEGIHVGVLSKNKITTDVSGTDSDKEYDDVDISPDEPVPADLQQILDIIKSQGGRMTQKDIRKRMKYSEGKVSLMLLDLERRGKIQKFKKGRGNIIFIVE